MDQAAWPERSRRFRSMSSLAGLASADWRRSKRRRSVPAGTDTSKRCWFAGPAGTAPVRRPWFPGSVNDSLASSRSVYDSRGQQRARKRTWLGVAAPKRTSGSECVPDRGDGSPPLEKNPPRRHLQRLVVGVDRPRLRRRVGVLGGVGGLERAVAAELVEEVVALAGRAVEDHRRRRPRAAHPELQRHVADE